MWKVSPGAARLNEIGGKKLNEYQLVTDYWVEFILLVIVIGHLLEHLIPLVIKAIKDLDHKETR